jgi:hypothetical protein
LRYGSGNGDCGQSATAVETHLTFIYGKL